MGEILGWVQLVELVTTLFSKDSRRDYPIALILILLLVFSASIALYYFR